jgi:hypothetical protein
MTMDKGEKELLQQLQSLPRELSPRHDPWPGIAARIARGDRLRSLRFQALAAAAVLVLAVGLIVGPELRREPVPAVSPAPLAGQASAQAERPVPALLAASEAEYVAALREFIPVGVSRSRLSDQAISTIEGSWTELQAAEEALVAALRQNPNDAFLNRRMLELRARQLHFLKQLATLDLSSRRLTI